MITKCKTAKVLRVPSCEKDDQEPKKKYAELICKFIKNLKFIYIYTYKKQIAKKRAREREREREILTGRDN